MVIFFYVSGYIFNMVKYDMIWILTKLQNRGSSEIISGEERWVMGGGGSGLSRLYPKPREGHLNLADA